MSFQYCNFENIKICHPLNYLNNNPELFSIQFENFFLSSNMSNLTNQSCTETIKNVCSFYELKDSLFFGLYGALFSMLYLWFFGLTLYAFVVMFEGFYLLLRKICKKTSEEVESPPNYRQATRRRNNNP